MVRPAAAVAVGAVALLLLSSPVAGRDHVSPEAYSWEDFQQLLATNHGIPELTGDIADFNRTASISGAGHTNALRLPGAARRRLAEVATATETLNAYKLGWTGMLDEMVGHMKGYDGAAPTDTTCSDPRADNVNTSGACTYSCGTLTGFYFSEDAAADTTCYLWTGTYFALNGAVGGSNLMELKQNTLDSHNFTDLWAGTGDLSFATCSGDGCECQNITLASLGAQNATLASGSVTAATETETVCIMPGLHETNHTHFALGSAPGDDEFVSSDGGDFQLGECTDVFIRVNTAEVSTSGAAVTWTLSDGSNTWIHSAPGAEGVHEYLACLFDHHSFALTRSTASTDGWVGTVQVVGWVPDSTIYIPIDGKCVPGTLLSISPTC